MENCKLFTPTDKDPIDQIAEVRAKNNTNWMDMLRLAFKENPIEAKKIMKRINECDVEISKLFKEVT